MFRPVARLAHSSSPFQSSFFKSRTLPRQPSPLSRKSDLNPLNRRRFYSFFRDPPSKEFQSKSNDIWILIGLNTAVFAAWQVVTHPKYVQLSRTNRQRLTQFMHSNFLTSYEHIKAGLWWTPLTASFSHMNIGHFGVNMYTFYNLAQILVWTPGLSAASMCTLIIGSAIAGSVTSIAYRASNNQRSVGLGFSTAVAGVTATVALLQPNAKVGLFGVIPMPLWVAGVLCLGVDTYGLDNSSTVGHDAHLGGAAFGALYYLLRLRRFGGVFGRGGAMTAK